MKKSYLPNSITVLRALLIFPIAWLLLAQHYTAGFYLFLIAALSDGVDGFLARRFQWISRFGSMADPVADKLLMLSCFATLTFLHHIPLWVFILVFVRDLVISFGALYYHNCIAHVDFRPILISKLNTVIQLVWIGLLLWHLSLGFVWPHVITVMMWVMVGTTFLSFVSYVWVWAWRAWRQTH
jgi:cardiolipin synthase